MPALRPVVLEFPKQAHDTFTVQPEGKTIPGPCVAKTCRFQVPQKFSGSIEVPFDSLWLAFPDLHTSGGQIDEALNKPGFGCGAAQGVPESLPGFVGFPVVPAVEEIQGVEPLGAGGE
jgi:hypothetical protein